MVPADNAAEARAGARDDGAAGARTWPSWSAATGCWARAGCPQDEPVVAARAGSEPEPVPDLRDVVGQDEARLALEIAAAGGHHLLMVGPPGAGKTMLAERLPGLLPALEPGHALEVTAIQSVLGVLPRSGALVSRPPFVAPHHGASMAAIIGGGSGFIRPGAISRAHRGVLFLDEAPEFRQSVLQALRQPAESGEVTIARASGVVRYPARFQLVLAANPCPCGRGLRQGSRLLLLPEGPARLPGQARRAAARPGRPAAPGARRQPGRVGPAVRRGDRRRGRARAAGPRGPGRPAGRRTRGRSTPRCPAR